LPARIGKELEQIRCHGLGRARQRLRWGRVPTLPFQRQLIRLVV